VLLGLGLFLLFVLVATAFRKETGTETGPREHLSDPLTSDL
jgi:hypothetical protein